MAFSDLEQILSKELNDELNALLMASIPVRQFYEKHWRPDFEFRKPQICPFHHDKEPSFVVGQEGWYLCHAGCKYGKGQSVIGFYKAAQTVGYKRNDVTWEVAQRELFNQYIARALDPKVAKLQHKRLSEDRELMEYIRAEKGWSLHVLRQLDIGVTYDEGKSRITVPVRNRFAMIRCVYYYNAFGHQGFPKYRMMERKRQFPTARPMEEGILFPHAVLWDNEKEQMRKELVFCEGCGDTLLALSKDIPAITTGSCGYKIRPRDLPFLKNRVIYLVYDMDGGGKTKVLDRAEQLQEASIPCKIVRLPFKKSHHTDLSDWMLREGHTKHDLLELIQKTEYYKSTPALMVHPLGCQKSREGGKKPQVRLQDIYEPRWHNEVFQTEGAVVGRSLEPYKLPAKIEVWCQEKNCKRECSLSNQNFIIDLPSYDPAAPVAKYIDMKTTDWARLAKSQLGLAAKCKVGTRISESHALTQILVSPPTTTLGREGKDDAGVTQITAYYFGTDIRNNLPYRFTGYTASHPRDGRALALFYAAEPLATSFESFEVDEEVRGALTPMRFVSDERLLDELLGYYRHLSRSVTGIRGRELMHMAMDLPFFSPVSFDFAGREVRNGALDIIVCGDTCCGKSQVADALQEYYQFGEVLTGENISYMNLVGGRQNIAKMQCISWGRLAVHDRGVVVIDEAHALTNDIFARMTDVRSKGRVQVSKGGIHGTANARVGLVFIANPREGTSMADYRYGVMAVDGIIRSAADIRRFDYVFTVSTSDVGMEQINVNGKDLEQHRFSREQCHALILWVKTRRKEDVVFTEEATHCTIEEAKRLSEKYSSVMDLLLPADARIKIARIAAAIAGRAVCSSDDFHRITVSQACVLAATEFLERIYDSNTSGLGDWANMVRLYDVVDEERVEKIIATHGNRVTVGLGHVLHQLMEHVELKVDDIQLIFDLNKVEAEYLRNALHSHRCIVRRTPSSPVFVPTSGFKRVVRAMMKREKGEKK